MKRRDLADALAVVPPHPAPSADWEQYVTPADIAADLLWQARDELAGARVLDLGCGTGVLAIGAALLGADAVVGFDVDAASVNIARDEAARRGLPCRFEVAALAEWREAGFDVAVMNPPFGAQRANRRGDRAFYDGAARALRAGGACWLLAPAPSAAFLAAFSRDQGWRMEQVGQWEYPLPATMAHHRDAVRCIPVIGVRLQIQ